MNRAHSDSYGGNSFDSSGIGNFSIVFRAIAVVGIGQLDDGSPVGFGRLGYPAEPIGEEPAGVCGIHRLFRNGKIDNL